MAVVPFDDLYKPGQLGPVELADARDTHKAEAAKTAIALKSDGSNSPSADIDWNGQKITNLANPAAAQDAATKAYVDTVSAGLRTRSEMLSVTIPAPVAAILTTGYATPGDGGGALYMRGAALTPGGFQSADGAFWGLAAVQSVRVEVFGAVGDGVTDDAPAINAAMAAAKALGIGEVVGGAKTYAIGSTLFWPGGCWLRGITGQSKLFLLDNSDCTMFESAGFSTWETWSSGSTAGYPMEGGIDGWVFEGNAEGQGAGVSVDLASLVFGVKVLSHRFGIGWLQVRNVKGVGIYTTYNSTLMNHFRSNDGDENGYQGDIQSTPSPYAFDRINVMDTLFESFIFEGPADISIRHLSTNYCGWLADPIPGVPVTSLLFPGEEIHSCRVETACELQHANLNDAIFGRALYVVPFIRFTGGSIIASSSWGAAKIDANAYGSIKALTLQQNKYSHGGVYKPHLECVKGTGSGAVAGKFSFPQVTCRRLGADPDSIGPMIYDDAGQQFGIIDGFDGNPTAGHGVVIGANNVGGVYRSVNFDSLQGAASDSTDSAGVMIEDGARDIVIQHVRLTDCARGIVNLGTNTRCRVLSGVVESNDGATTGQVALEGVTAASQVASVIAGSGTVLGFDLSKWGLTIMDNNTRYENSWSDQATLDTSTTGTRLTVTVNHNMWRDPSDTEVQISPIINGTTSANTPEFAYLNIFNPTATGVTLAYEVSKSPGVAPSVQRVNIAVN